MKTILRIVFPAFLLIFFFIQCSDHKTSTSESTEVPEKNKIENIPAGNSDLQSPDFSDPAVKQYYADYTAYLKKTVTSIRNKDEAGTMKILREEDSRWGKEKEKMEAKAKSSPEEEQKFNTWLMQIYVPYDKEIVQSDYYKKYAEEHRKNVQEDLKRKGIIN